VIFRQNISVEEKLQLKVGAQVMFVKTICHSKKFFNGKMGVIKSLRSRNSIHFPGKIKPLKSINTDGHSVQSGFTKLEVEEVLGTLCIIHQVSLRLVS
jgi:hypothetical protein